ncbi:flavodoxin [Stenotrophomonas sp. AB1(2024)]|uniref:flavodoxin n=1 Tax=Stenotrophomonas sp. AB1(2024) TaxID=3132215 RepID=UPI0030AB37ED
MHALIAYASLSGNTREVARMVAARCSTHGHCVTLLDVDDAQAAALAARPHDRLLLGCWTDNAGRTPAEMKRFVGALRDADALPPPERVAVFGTGETQWGLEYYCGAAHRLARWFGSPHPVLEIEQMPHGQADARTIHHWTDTVLVATGVPVPC